MGHLDGLLAFLSELDCRHTHSIPHNQQASSLSPVCAPSVSPPTEGEPQCIYFLIVAYRPIHCGMNSMPVGLQYNTQPAWQSFPQCIYFYSIYCKLHCVYTFGIYTVVVPLTTDVSSFSTPYLPQEVTSHDTSFVLLIGMLYQFTTS